MKVASLFTGCGGGDLGLVGGFDFNGKRYNRLPFDVVYAVDCDPKAVNTYNRNFKLVAVDKKVEACKNNEIPEHDLLVGGFPCQSFSSVNPTKDPFDERGQLYKHMARILRSRKPTAFIAENVKGMLTLMGGSIFKSIHEEFSKQGYNITYQLLNAADYGVPQKRQRVFMVGIRKDIPVQFQFPKPTHSENGGPLNTWTPIGNVIDSLVPTNPKYYFSERAVRGMKSAKNNMKRGLAQDLSKPSLTITSHLSKVSINSRDPVLLVDPKKELYRRFTPREAARIQSFPDSFVFSGSDADAYHQIGNAIPPVLMWHVAKSLATQIRDYVG